MIPFQRLQVPIRFTLMVLLAATLPGMLRGQNAPPLSGSSAGAEIQAAAKAAAQNRPREGPIEVLTDTQGVDFGPYLKDVIANVRENWYRLIPKAAEIKKGKVAIEFAILKSGQIADVRLVTSAGADLDRPAIASITESSPFPILPEAFHGQYLALRFHYYYNPEPADLSNNRTPTITADASTRAQVIQSVADANIPTYPPRALSDKVDGVVRLAAVINTKGTVKYVSVLEGDPLLVDASVSAIKKWRFHPATINNALAEDTVRIRVDFRLKDEKVKARVVSPEPPANSEP